MTGTSTLRAAVVLGTTESVCLVRDGDAELEVAYAPPFPRPHAERVSPGHAVAIATGADGAERVVWRWYDVVVLGPTPSGQVRVWEPGHGEVVADRRDTGTVLEPGSRAWASAGLPGAGWWVAGPVAGGVAALELDDVRGLYDEHDLWAAAFSAQPSG